MENNCMEISKGTVREISLEGLIDQLEVFYSWRRKAEVIYHITERFGTNLSTYNLINLTGEFDLEMVTFTDKKEYLLENITPLSFFMEELVTGISYLWDKSASTYIATIVFSSGSITIETNLNE